MKTKLSLFLCFFWLILSGLRAQQQQDLYLLIGQSNMAGRALIEPADTHTLAKVWLINDQNELTQAKNPLNLYSTVRKDKTEIQRMGPGYYFAKTLSEAVSDTIVLIVQARGGTPIEKWMKDSPFAYYEAALNRTKNAIKAYPKLQLKGVLWQQGESNRHNPEQYLPQLKKMIADYRQDLKLPHLPFFIGEMGKWNPSYEAIRAKILEAPQQIENVYVVSSKGLTNMDEHHFDSKSQRELGRRYAQLCKRGIDQNPEQVPNRAKRLIQMLQSPVEDYVMVVAHRGDWRYAPENSLPAIQNCIKMGVDMVEIDVQLTKDSIPVLLHDKTLDRTTTGKGKVADFNYAQIQKLFLRDGMGHPTSWKIPTLEEAMQLAKGNILVNLDKADAIIPVVYPILKKTNTVQHVAIGSYASWQEMRKQVGSYLDSIYFMPKLSDASVDIHQYLKAYFEHLKVPVVQVKFKQEDSKVFDHLDYIKSSGKWIWLNTITADRSATHHDNRAINDLEGTYGWVVKQGFNMIQTDRPGLLLDYLREKGLHE